MHMTPTVRRRLRMLLAGCFDASLGAILPACGDLLSFLQGRHLLPPLVVASDNLDSQLALSPPSRHISPKPHSAAALPLIAVPAAPDLRRLHQRGSPLSPKFLPVEPNLLEPVASRADPAGETLRPGQADLASPMHVGHLELAEPALRSPAGALRGKRRSERACRGVAEAVAFQVEAAEAGRRCVLFQSAGEDLDCATMGPGAGSGRWVSPGPAGRNGFKHRQAQAG